MATIVETIGGATANSYVTEAEAVTYFDEHTQDAVWTALSATEKIRALITAARRIDQEDFKGVIADSITPQALQWPREGQYDRDGVVIANDALPVDIQRAQMELAVLLGDGESNPLGESGLEAFERVKVGGLDITLSQDESAGESLPPQVRRFLDHYTHGSGVGGFSTTR